MGQIEVKNVFLPVLLSMMVFPQTNNLTSYDELSAIVYALDKSSDILKVEVIGKSVAGRNLYGMFFSESVFGEDKDKVKVLFFAQQHGNEQSGKEGALKLASDLLNPENKYLLERIDFVLIPQVNPDGSENNIRFNANGIDLNRNHLLLSESETVSLHNLFNKYHFHVSLDVHEYYPYSKSWKEFGFIKNADEQFGLTSNLNVPESIRKYSKDKVLPFMRKRINDKGFSFNEYLVGGPPNLERLRHSTVDINDGRQSLGVQGTLSFILEGKNGKDSSADNINFRAEGQKTAMLGLLNFVYENASEIKSMILEEREISKNDNVVIRMEHVGSGESIIVPAQEVNAGKDTFITISNYHPVVNSRLEVSPPEGYLIPASDTLLMNFLSNHNINYSVPDLSEFDKVVQMKIIKIDSMDLEETRLADVKFTIEESEADDIPLIDYMFVPLDQNPMKRNTIVTAFEPQSMLGLVQYERFSYLIQKDTYPILRVMLRK